jgi:hypothetical protein
MKDTTYNGWTNYETWNVALWIGGDEKLYRLSQSCASYDDWLASMRCIGSETTGDNIRWDDPTINHKELDVDVFECEA